MDAVLTLGVSGARPKEISALTGVPRSTVDRWLRNGGPSRRDSSDPSVGCFRCAGRPPADPAAYLYLLGLYLGDGTLVRMRNGVLRLEISQDARYPSLAAAAGAAIEAVLPVKAGARSRRGCVVVTGYSRHWQCLFPQAGPGRKHERPIVLAAWQRRLVEADPRPLLRGLVHSDGGRHSNVVGSVDYPRYQFTNASSDILAIFAWCCDLLGVRWTRTSERRVAVSRRRDVAALDAFVEPKS